MNLPTIWIKLHRLAGNLSLNYKGAVLIVSHDRYFLDKIAGKIIEIDQTRATSYTGNYSDYAVKREHLSKAPP